MWLALLIIVLLIPKAVHAEYLGDLSANPYRPDSTANPFGRYGNPFSGDSLNNPFGAGNPYRSTARAILTAQAGALWEGDNGPKAQPEWQV